MVFSSTVFLFIFLPAVLATTFVLPVFIRNFFLLIASLFFYAWGEGNLVILLIGITAVNFFLGAGISSFRNTIISRSVLITGLVFNLSILFYYKYLNFFAAAIPVLGEYVLARTNNSIVLPIGISFYTFHSISYLVDVYSTNLQNEKNPINLGLYIAFFPQLIAGPIVRYADIAEQLKSRSITQDFLFEGAIRFIRGLAKKVIIANTVGQISDSVFKMNVADIPTSMAWLGVICFALQIYFDFSGYSDMAIGLAKMFGFQFKENFNYPYAASSMRDFWRRWHISLSKWFRDYVYIPLGGNQRGPFRTYLNLLIIFIITGLWHGAYWTFMIWGIYHGVFLIMERIKILDTDKWSPWLRHLYVILVVLISWVLFRSPTVSYSIDFLKSMAGFSKGSEYLPVIFINYYSITAIVAGLLFSTPVRITLKGWEEKTFSVKYRMIGVCLIYLSLFLISIDELALTSFNPFIYFRF